jgi:hypothetical protein
MNTKKSFVSILALSAIGLVTPHLSNAGAVLGYFDPSTGSFVPTPRSPLVNKIPPQAPVSATGTVKVVMALTIESAIGTDEAITCLASIAVDDASFENSASASGVVGRTGAKGALTLSIPYDWTMAAAGEHVSVSITCTEGAIYGASGGVSHSITFVEVPFVVPATGTTTTINATATI